jgi:hypothetical protein
LRNKYLATSSGLSRRCPRHVAVMPYSFSNPKMRRSTGSHAYTVPGRSRSALVGPLSPRRADRSRTDQAVRGTGGQPNRGTFWDTFDRFRMLTIADSGAPVDRSLAPSPIMSEDW